MADASGWVQQGKKRKQRDPERPPGPSTEEREAAARLERQEHIFNLAAALLSPAAALLRGRGFAYVRVVRGNDPDDVDRVQEDDNTVLLPIMDNPWDDQLLFERVHTK